MLADISDYTNNSDYWYILIAILVVDIVVLFLARYLPDIFGKNLNIWYDRFDILAVISDVFIIAIGFAITRYLYTTFFAPTMPWSPFYFITLLVLVQLVHDILFYIGPILNIPKGHNEMMDVFRAYSEGGAKILFGDAGLMISSALVAMVLKEQPEHITASVGLLAVYTMPYILYTKNKFSD